MNKSLIMLNMSHRFDWEKGMVNRNYHVLQALKTRKSFSNILSVDFLPFTIKKRIKVLLKGRLWRKGKGCVCSGLSYRVDKDEEYEGLYHVTAISLKKLHKVIKKIEFPIQDLTIWSYNPFTADDLAMFPKAKVVFDAVDNWIEHPSYTNYQEKLKNCYKSIQKRADIIFTVSEGLIDLFDKRENVFFIPNGVDVNHFKNAKCNTNFSDKYLGGVEDLSEKKIVGYHGVIQSRVNISVFDYLAEKHPEFQFVIIGPVWKEAEKDIGRLKKYDNVHIIGTVPYSELPSVIQCFDVAIIPHRVDKFTQSMNPLKIYEYLAAGKPIISTAIAGADQFQDLISLAVSPEDFSVKIEKVISEESEELIRRRKAMAENYDWRQRVELMMEVIDKNNKQESR